MNPLHIMSDDELALLSPWPGPPWASASDPKSFNDVLRYPSGCIITSHSVTTVFLNVSRVNEIYLRCSDFISEKVHGVLAGFNDVLCRIDVNSPSGTILTGQTPTNCSVLIGDFGLNMLHFKLTDAEGNVLTLHDDGLTFILVLS